LLSFSNGFDTAKKSAKNFKMISSNRLGHFQSRQFLPLPLSAGNAATAQVPAGYRLGQGY
jgi:hypothetical protein